MTNTPYIAKNIDSDYLAKIMNGLSNISKKSVVTGVKEGKEISVHIGEGKGKYCLSSKSPFIDRQFHGTVDTFASAFAGFFTLGLSLEESAKEATRKLNDAGIRVIVLTGDNAEVTKCVCDKVGIKSAQIVTGTQIDRLADQGVKRLLKKTNIFAKLLLLLLYVSTPK